MKGFLISCSLLLCVLFIAQMKLCFLKTNLPEQHVLIPIVGLLTDEPITQEEKQPYLMKLQESGIQLGTVYRGISRMGSTLSIDDLGIGLQALIQSTNGAVTPEQKSMVEKRLRSIRMLRDKLEATQKNISIAENEIKTITFCLLSLLEPAQVRALAESFQIRVEETTHE